MTRQRHGTPCRIQSDARVLGRSNEALLPRLPSSFCQNTEARDTGYLVFSFPFSSHRKRESSFASVLVIEASREQSPCTGLFYCSSSPRPWPTVPMIKALLNQITLPMAMINSSVQKPTMDIHPAKIRFVSIEVHTLIRWTCEA